MSQRLNLLMLTPAYYPAVGGGEAHVRYLAEGLTRRGHSVLVLTDQVSPSAPSIECVNGVQVMRTDRYRSERDRPGRVGWEEAVFGVLRDCAERLEGRRFDLIHGHCLVSGVLGAMLAPSLACPLVVSVHDTQPESEPMGEGRCHLVFRHVPYDVLIAGSRFFRDQALAHGAGAAAIRLIYYGIDLRHFRPRAPNERMRRTIGLSADDRVVLLIGRFKPRKGQLEFVRAMVRVLAVHPRARALVNGSCHSASPEFLDEIKREARRLGLGDRVIIWDAPWRHDDIPQLYALADLVVQPSHAEGFGLAVVEAMAMGRPVIGANATGLREIITHGETGWLVPPGDDRSLADAISSLLTDTTAAQRLARAGAALVRRRFSADRMVDETLQAYSDALVHWRARTSSVPALPNPDTCRVPCGS